MQPVVTLAQTLIQRNPGRVRGPLVARAGNPVGEIHNVQWRSIEEEAQGLATFIRRKVDQGIDPGLCLILAASRKVGYAIRDAVQATGADIRFFFREEAVENEPAQVQLTLLTLLANPDDRVALRSWIGFGSNYGLSGSYRHLVQAAAERGTGVREVLEAIEAGNLRVPFAAHPMERWRELQRRLAELEPLRDNIPALIDAALPEIPEPGPENDHALLRRVALSCVPDVESVEELPTMIRYRIGQPEVPLETPYARVMSFHKSKGLTAQLVILAGLVDGLVPRIDSADPLPQQELQRQEQRRLFFVGMTRTTEILVFSSYSQLPSNIAHNLQVRRGAFIPGANAYRVFASPFLEETGPTLPAAVRGADWIA